MENNKLDHVFQLTEENELFSFLKDYAYQNKDLADALLRRFLPNDINLEALREEVRSILWSIDESGYRWGPSLNWHQVEEQLSRMMDKATYYDAEGEYDAAASIAAEILLFVGEHYAQDRVYECEYFDGHDFRTRDAANLLISLVESNVLDTDLIERIRDEINKAGDSETFTSYCMTDLEELQSVLDGVFDDFHKHLADLDERIAHAGKAVGYRNRWLYRKVAYLSFKGEKEMAEKEIDTHFDVPELSRLRIDKQVFDGHYEDAVRSLDKAIDCTEDRYYVSQCHERKRELLERIGDLPRLAEELEYLVLNSYSSVFDLYSQWKGTLKELAQMDRIPGIINQLITKKHTHCQKDIARICAEEKMLSQLAECLSWNGGYGDDCYEALAEYGQLLDHPTREKIVAGHLEVIRKSAIPTNSRHYSYIRAHMEALRDSCDEGHRGVKLLAEEFQNQYSRRPSMMKELAKLDI